MSSMRRGLAWAALCASAFLVSAAAPALGTGAIYRPEPRALCAIEGELEIEAVPTRVVAGAKGSSLEFAVDVTSRVPGTIRANFGYTLYDDEGNVLQTGTQSSGANIQGLGRFSRGIEVLDGLSPGFYRLHVVAAAISAENNRLLSEAVVYLEVDASNSTLMISPEEWQQRSAYNIGISYDPGAARTAPEGAQDGALGR